MDTRMQGAIEAAESGDNETARELLREILKTEPNNESAWLWLSQAVESDAERGFCLGQVLRINPENKVAQQGVTHLGKRAPASVEPRTGVSPDAFIVKDEPDSPLPESEPEAALDGEPSGGPEAAATLSAVAVSESAVETGPGLDREKAQEEEPEGGPSEEVAAEAGVGVTPVLLPDLDAGTVSAGAAVAATAQQPDDESVPRTAPELDEAPALDPDADTIIEPFPVAAPDIEPESDADTITAPPPIAAPPAPREPVPVIERPRRRGCCIVLALAALLLCLITGAVAIDAMYLHAADVERFAQSWGIPLPAFLAPPTSEVQRPTAVSAAEGEATPLPGEPAVEATASGAGTEEGPSSTPSPVGTPADAGSEGSSTPPGPGALTPSVAKVAELAPVRIRSVSFYPSAAGGIISMTLDLDAQGDSRIVVDEFGIPEEWLVIDSVVLTGAHPPRGMVPYEPVEDPAAMGLGAAAEVFSDQGPRGHFSTRFPLHAILEGWAPHPADESAGETVHEMETVRYRAAIDPEHLPDFVVISQAEDMPRADFAAAVESDAENQVAHVWVEPQTGAIVKAQWRLVFPDGQRVEYTLDALPGPVPVIERPVEAEGTVPDIANPSAVYCEDEGFAYEIRTAADGSQSGYCLFPDGSECEGWAFYRAECQPGQVFPSGVISPSLEITPSPTVEATPLPLTSPEGAVQLYWSLVGAGDYDQAWELLSVAYRSRRYAGELAEYAVTHEAMQLCDVDATDIRAVDQSTLQTLVKATVVYRSGAACRPSAYHFQFTLLYDKELGAWTIDDIVWR